MTDRGHERPIAGDPPDGPDLEVALGPPTLAAARRSPMVEQARLAHEAREERQVVRSAEVTAWLAARRRGERRRRVRRILVTTTVLAAVLAGGSWVRSNPETIASWRGQDDVTADGSTDHRASTSDVSTAAESTTAPPAVGAAGQAAVPTVPDAALPPPNLDARPSYQRATTPTPLGTPPPVAADGPHQFMTVGLDGEPAAYDPCRAISVVTNSRTAPPDGDALIDSALAELSRATGLVFVRTGTSDEIPTADRAPYLPDRFGDRWAPVLIGWTDPSEVPELEGATVGRGGSGSLDIGAQRVYLTGSVALDGPAIAIGESHPNGFAWARAVILHELGHLVGLDHVDDPGQLMFPNIDTQLEYGAGDLAGLARLGSGPCFDVL